MKTKAAVVIIVCIVAVATFCVADPSSSPPNSATDLAAITTELHQTQAQLERAVARITLLEQQMADLQKSNAELRRELRTLQAPHLVPAQSDPGPQAPQAPQAPQGLRVVPLQSGAP